MLLALAAAIHFFPAQVNRPLPVDERAQQYLNETLIKTSAAFAAAKGLNAAISLVQESSIQLQPMGLGLDLAAGQVLDPINDLVERASWVFLAAMTSVGIQQFLLRITPWLSMEVLLCIGLVLYALALWNRRGAGFRARGLAIKIMVAAVILRLMIPVSVLVYDHVDQRFLAENYRSDMAEIQQAETDMDALQQDMVPGTDEQQTMEQDRSWAEKLDPRPYLSALSDLKKRVQAAVERITDMAANTGDTLVRLVTLFVIQTMVLPLATLWLLAAALRMVAHGMGAGRTTPPAAQEPFEKGS
jgi:hypothetical protein